jgi:DNA-3-methyladenine glycosylase
VTTAGPGRLTRALAITREDDAQDLVDRSNRIFIAERERRPRIATSARVGVAYAGEWADRPWRFFDAESAHVSRPPARSIGRPVEAAAVSVTAVARRRRSRAEPSLP